MADNIDLNLLLDFYGPLLSESQRKALELYYGDDMTLTEIAAELEISRQAAQQNIKKGKAELGRLEEGLGLCDRLSQLRKYVAELRNISELSGEPELAAKVSGILDRVEKLL